MLPNEVENPKSRGFGFLLEVLHLSEYNPFMSDDTILFVASTPLGFQVRVTRAYWEVIVTIKHPAMAGREEDVRKAWNSLMKSVKASRMKMCFYFTGLNEQSDGYVRFPGRQVKKAF